MTLVTTSLTNNSTTLTTSSPTAFACSARTTCPRDVPGAVGSAGIAIVEWPRCARDTAAVNFAEAAVVVRAASANEGGSGLIDDAPEQDNRDVAFGDSCCSRPQGCGGHPNSWVPDIDDHTSPLPIHRFGPDHSRP